MNEKKNVLQSHNFYYDITVTIKQNVMKQINGLQK